MTGIINLLLGLLMSTLSFVVMILNNIIFSMFKYKPTEGAGFFEETGKNALQSIVNYFPAFVNIGRAFIPISMIFAVIFSMFRIIGGMLSPPSARREHPIQAIINLFVSLILINYSIRITAWIAGVGAQVYSIFDNPQFYRDAYDSSAIETENIFVRFLKNSGQLLLVGLVGGFSGVGLAGIGVGIVSSLVLLVIGYMMLIAYIRLVLEVLERYLMLGIMVFFSPLAFMMLSIESTKPVFKNYLQMLIMQTIVMSFSIIFLRIFQTTMTRGLLASIKGVNMVGLTLMLTAFLKVGQEVDSHLKGIGLTVAQGGGLAGEFFGAVASVSKKLEKMERGRGGGGDGSGKPPKGALAGDFKKAMQQDKATLASAWKAGTGKNMSMSDRMKAMNKSIKEGNKATPMMQSRPGKGLHNVKKHKHGLQNKLNDKITNAKGKGHKGLVTEVDGKTAAANTNENLKKALNKNSDQLKAGKNAKAVVQEDTGNSITEGLETKNGRAVGTGLYNADKQGKGEGLEITDSNGNTIGTSLRGPGAGEILLGVNDESNYLEKNMQKLGNPDGQSMKFDKNGNMVPANKEKVANGSKINSQQAQQALKDNKQLNYTTYNPDGSVNSQFQMVKGQGLNADGSFKSFDFNRDTGEATEIAGGNYILTADGYKSKDSLGIKDNGSGIGGNLKFDGEKITHPNGQQTEVPNGKFGERSSFDDYGNAKQYKFNEETGKYERTHLGDSVQTETGFKTKEELGIDPNSAMLTYSQNADGSFSLDEEHGEFLQMADGSYKLPSEIGMSDSIGLDSNGDVQRYSRQEDGSYVKDIHGDTVYTTDGFQSFDEMGIQRMEEGADNISVSGAQSFNSVPIQERVGYGDSHDVNSDSAQQVLDEGSSVRLTSYDTDGNVLRQAEFDTSYDSETGKGYIPEYKEMDGNSVEVAQGEGDYFVDNQGNRHMKEDIGYNPGGNTNYDHIGNVAIEDASNVRTLEGHASLDGNGLVTRVNPDNANELQVFARTSDSSEPTWHTLSDDAAQSIQDNGYLETSSSTLNLGDDFRTEYRPRDVDYGGGGHGARIGDALDYSDGGDSKLLLSNSSFDEDGELRMNDDMQIWATDTETGEAGWYNANVDGDIYEVKHFNNETGHEVDSQGNYDLNRVADAQLEDSTVSFRDINGTELDNRTHIMAKEMFKEEIPDNSNLNFVEAVTGYDNDTDIYFSGRNDFTSGGRFTLSKDLTSHGFTKVHGKEYADIERSFPQDIRDMIHDRDGYIKEVYVDPVTQTMGVSVGSRTEPDDIHFMVNPNNKGDTVKFDANTRTAKMRGMNVVITPYRSSMQSPGIENELSNPVSLQDTIADFNQHVQSKSYDHDKGIEEFANKSRKKFISFK